MNSTVYLDNSATTKPCKTAISRITQSLEQDWGNPSSLHLLGLQAAESVERTREAVASLLRCRADEIYFTSGGTESNNTALIGAVKAREKRGRRIVTTSIEHPSVLETVRLLGDMGFEVVFLKPDSSGKITEEQLFDAVTPDTILVSIMLVNNETGTIQPVKAAAEAIKRAKAPALLHCDAVQAFGKLPINVNELGIDLLSISGHKIHASKGIGVLYIKKGVTVRPLITGGGQEKGLRSGTEAVPLICGLQGAIEELPNLTAQLKTERELWNYAVERLCDSGLAVLNSARDGLPYVLNISLCGYRSETLLHFLEAKGIYVSSGSACAKGEGSYVLKEMGLDRARIDSALRISFSRYNTREDIDKLSQALTLATKTLRKAK